MTQREKCLVAKITCRVKIFKNTEREIFENTLFKKLKLGPLLSRLLIGQFKPRNFVYFFFFFFVKDQKTGFITGWSRRKNKRIFVLRRRLKFNNYPTAILLRYNTTITSEKMPAQVTIPWEY